METTTEAPQWAMWQAKAEKARDLLDDLGGAAEWKDVKLEWEDDAF